MNALKVVRHLLSASSALSAIVGTRIWAGYAEEQAQRPLIVYRLLSVERLPALDMESEREVHATVEITVVSSSYEQMLALGEYVRLALTYNESINTTIDGVFVLRIECLPEDEDQYAPVPREDWKVFTYLVHHTE